MSEEVRAHSALLDSAHGSGKPNMAGLPPKSPQQQPPAAGDGAPAVAAAAADAGGSALPRKSGWQGAKSVLTAVRAAGRFTTLRDLYGTEVYVDHGRLDLLKHLGEGAFAKVQHARLRPEEGGEATRDVAVKTLRQELLEDPEQVQLFVKEVSLLRKLRHKHIVEFVGCSWQRASLDDSASRPSKIKTLFYVQEYCGGGSLGDLVRKQMIQPFKKLYSDADALRWSLHIALALDYLHSANPVVIHRDLKLENVMLTGADLAAADAKLGDFGLARLFKAAERQKMDRLTKLLSQPRRDWDPSSRRSSKNLDAMLDRMLTNTSNRTLSRGTSRTTRSNPGGQGPPSALSSAYTAADMSRAMTGKTGSFGYMAPEVSRSQQYNSKADVFSLGMIMYNLFCRTIPTVQILLCGDESALELYAAKVAEGYRPPLLPTVPASVKAVIEACWKGDAELRPTAGEVVGMLRAVEESGDCKALSAADGAKGGGCCTVM